MYSDNAAQYWLSKLINDKDFLSMCGTARPGTVVLLSLKIASHDFIFLNSIKFKIHPLHSISVGLPLIALWLCQSNPQFICCMS